MDYNRKDAPIKGCPEGKGSDDITGRLMPTFTGKYENNSDKNAFYIEGIPFFKPKENDYKHELITKVQGEENRRYRIFERTIYFCVGAMALATVLLGITGFKRIYDYYNEGPKTITPIVREFESQATPKFVVPDDILEKQEEQIRNILESQRELLKQDNTQGTTIEDVIR